MAFPRIGGPGAPLDLSNLGFNELELQAGQVWTLQAGTYQVVPGPYSQLQTLDPITGLWRGFGAAQNSSSVVGSDGNNWRLANLTGCAVGAYVTNVGSGYTSAPAVAASDGNSTWTAIVGGAITAIAVGNTTMGSKYTYPPVVVIAAPPQGGVQATATVALNGNGTLGNVTMVDNGAGYTSVPAVTFQNDRRDTTGSGAKATATVAGAGEITAVICTNHGTALTAVPTLTFTGGGGNSAAATVVMDFVATGFTVVGTGNLTYGNASGFLVITDGGRVAGAAGAVTNPAISTDLVKSRPAVIAGTTTAGGNISATNAVIGDAGQFPAVPGGYVISGANGNATQNASVTITVGGVNDRSFIQPI